MAVDVAASSMPDGDTYMTPAGTTAVKGSTDDVSMLTDVGETQVLTSTDGTALAWHTGDPHVPVTGTYKLGLTAKQAAIARWVANHRPT